MCGTDVARRGQAVVDRVGRRDGTYRFGSLLIRSTARPRSRNAERERAQRPPPETCIHAKTVGFCGDYATAITRLLRTRQARRPSRNITTTELEKNDGVVGIHRREGAREHQARAVLAAVRDTVAPPGQPCRQGSSRAGPVPDEHLAEGGGGEAATRESKTIEMAEKMEVEGEHGSWPERRGNMNVRAARCRRWKRWSGTACPVPSTNRGTSIPADDESRNDEDCGPAQQGIS